MKYVLGIDLGTSGTKTVLFDQGGQVMASATVEYPMAQPHNGWAEQDPADWWRAAVATIRQVLARSGVDARDVKALGISGQMHGLVMLDEAGEVLRTRGEGALVVDVGINVDQEGRLCGDVDFASLEGRAAAATPVPGGVGGVTTAVLALHLIRAARQA